MISGRIDLLQDPGGGGRTRTASELEMQEMKGEDVRKVLEMKEDTVDQDFDQDLVTGNKTKPTTAMPSSGGSENKDGESCKFNKRGVCKKHKVLGIKTTSKKKVWSKKKFGWGWATVTSINYSCMVDDRSRSSATNDRDGEVSCFSRVDQRGSIDTCIIESSRSLVGEQISEAAGLEVTLGPND